MDPNIFAGLFASADNNSNRNNANVANNSALVPSRPQNPGGQMSQDVFNSILQGGETKTTTTVARKEVHGESKAPMPSSGIGLDAEEIVREAKQCWREEYATGWPNPYADYNFRCIDMLATTPMGLMELQRRIMESKMVRGQGGVSPMPWMF
ncbi:hypothetical protein LTR37_007177 [Vermiconidia calcicola]|uniref:Uncharacterized protein n=1 Tax=Vermiconidia calcicola TaxID=1690605 RepID=A0ACC3NG19_9PEZI|nr:hypothetical protein LTR37_007177 [Vermiconidia calcicola]